MLGLHGQILVIIKSNFHLSFSFPITFSRNKLPAITLIVYYTYCSQASNVLQTITVFQLIYTGNIFIIKKITRGGQE
ncbi:hypothetical protein RUMOBE_03740 [Blautia obeum ATCC 29174]|uniref:Uncharacterized protein n=1 Tax=Blautia obeum ATCC 29174 TaxID=411459 RepID=A5ZXI8_9FIRM|nr:hypothetical protein RUMOBE_03740 [Blautia obeum ATCC 29174]